MDLSKLLHGFVKVFTWILSMYFSHFANKAEVWPTFQSLLKLLLWTKGVEWVKILNVLGPLCLWQCFFTLPVNRLTNIVSEHQPTISGNLMIGHGYNRDLTNNWNGYTTQGFIGTIPPLIHALDAVKDTVAKQRKITQAFGEAFDLCEACGWDQIETFWRSCRNFF